MFQDMARRHAERLIERAAASTDSTERQIYERMSRAWLDAAQESASLDMLLPSRALATPRRLGREPPLFSRALAKLGD